MTKFTTNKKKKRRRRASLVVQSVKHPPAMQKTWVQSLGQEDPLEGEMATHSGILAWIIPWTEKPGSLYSPWGRRELDTTNIHRHWKKDGCTLSCSVMSDSLWPQGLGTRLLYPWDFPGKNTRVGCRFILQGIFLTQGSNLHLLYWQTDSLPLSHLGSPERTVDVANQKLSFIIWLYKDETPDHSSPLTFHTPKRSPEWTPGMRLSMFWKKLANRTHIVIFRWFYEPSFLHLLLSRKVQNRWDICCSWLAATLCQNSCLIAWSPCPFTSILFLLTFLSNSSKQWRLFHLLAGW